MFDNNYFQFSMPGTSDENLPLFDHSQFGVGTPGQEEDPFNNLSLKLRGNVFEQDVTVERYNMVNPNADVFEDDHVANFERSIDSVRNYANHTPTDTFNYIHNTKLSKANMSDLSQRISFADLKPEPPTDFKMPVELNSEQASVGESGSESCNKSNEMSYPVKPKEIDNSTQSVFAMSERDSYGSTKDYSTTYELDLGLKRGSTVASPKSIHSPSFSHAEVYKTPNYKAKKSKKSKKADPSLPSDLQAPQEPVKKVIKTPQEQIKKYGVKLATRKDVVSKTLLRSLKRFFTESFSEKFDLSKTEKTDSYLQKLSQFTQELFCTKGIEMNDWNVSMEELVKFLSILVSPTHIKFALKTEEDLSLYKEFYSCIYQYSHKKLNKMLSNKVCGFLFHEFVKEGNLERFIQKCPTMSQYPSVYMDMGSKFLQTITQNLKQDFF